MIYLVCQSALSSCAWQEEELEDLTARMKARMAEKEASLAAYRAGETVAQLAASCMPHRATRPSPALQKLAPLAPEWCSTRANGTTYTPGCPTCPPCSR